MLLAVLQRLFGVVSLVVLGVGAYLVWSWWRLHEYVQGYGPPDLSLDRWPERWRVWVGGALIAWAFLGRMPVGLLLGRRGDDAERMHKPQASSHITGDGSNLYVDSTGPESAPVLILVHGWGLESGIWWEARRMLSQRYEVVVFDLAGLGRSRGPSDKRYTLDRYADHLMQLVRRASPRKVVLVGHSIGGMILQQFCERYPETLGRQVQGLVFENTTFQDPTRTVVAAPLFHTLKPVISFFMRLEIWLQPVAWAMNWHGYLSGSTHMAMRLGGFGTTPTRAQLNQVALDATRNPPAVQAKGNLTMIRWPGAQGLEGARVPALVFVGGRDLVTRDWAGRTLARRLPQAEVREIEDAGHLGPMERAEVYNDAILRFVDRLFLRRAASTDRAQPGRSAPPVSEVGPRPPGESRPFA